MVKGWDMVAEIHRLRDKPGETEKITINVGFVDLGHIDLLVREGFYTNRTDFIRTSIRNQLASHADAAKQSIVGRNGSPLAQASPARPGRRNKRDPREAALTGAP